MNKHEHFMRRALALARRGAGTVSPNPMVGALVVRQDSVVAGGWHERFGGNHAEVNALNRAGKLSDGATLYVTLEPCNHQGKTPPCTHAIMNAGISRVVYATRDPNRTVTGGGTEALRGAGIEVIPGVLEHEAIELNCAWLYTTEHRSSFVTLKVALTKSGKIATDWVTSEIARAQVHRLRRMSDAILVGAGTVINDNPALTNRSGRGRNPARIVLDSQLRTPPDSRVYNKDGARRILLTKNSGSRAGIEMISLPAADGRVDLHAAFRELYRLGFCSILCEGGSALSTALLTGRLCQRVIVYTSAKDGPGLSFSKEALESHFHLRFTKRVGADTVSLYEAN